MSDKRHTSVPSVLEHEAGTHSTSPCQRRSALADADH